MATHIVNNAQKLGPAVKTFCDFPRPVADALEQEALTTTHPTGAVLFAEGQAPRGVFIVRRGRVKLSICGSDGRTLILRVVEPGALLGVAAAVSGRQYEATAETQEPCEISFLRQVDLLRLMRRHGELTLAYSNSPHASSSRFTVHGNMCRSALRWQSFVTALNRAIMVGSRSA
jgi:CRP-like cAMP-binding protein